MANHLAANSVIVTYRNNSNTIYSPNGSVQLQTPINFYPHDVKRIKLLRASISSAIPNVYTLGTFNNGMLRVTRDGGANWSVIQLPNGVYTVPMIQAAITSAIVTWYTLATDPAIAIAYNLATNLVYITLDSTKLVVPGGQIGIDMSVSLFHTLLGYQAIQQFIVDGVYGADENAQLDWFGNNISIVVDGLGAMSYINTSLSQELCQIPLATAVVTNEYQFPHDGLISPYINCGLSDKLRQVAFSFVGSRSDVVAGATVFRSIVLLEGIVTVSIEILWGRV